MLTRQHYKAIAEILATNQAGFSRIDDDSITLVECIARDLAEYFVEDNPRFNRSRFMTACGLEVR